MAMMKNMTPAAPLSKARAYLEDILGHEAVATGSQGWAKPWSGARDLPAYLQSTYHFYQATLFGHSCLLMLASSPEGETPAVVRKHWQTISALFKGDVIYMIEGVSSYNRKRLIEQRVPFLVPGNQLYLPNLGIQLREHFKADRQIDAKHLSAPAQVLVLREIYHRDCTGLRAKDLASLLEYSPMTITRAIRELTDRQLASAEKVGREKYLEFLFEGQELWKAAEPMLENPASKSIWVVWKSSIGHEISLEGKVAGESALAHYTALAEARTRHWAIPAKRWTTLSKSPDVHILKDPQRYKTVSYSKDREAMEIELWAYDPKLIATDSPWVDPLSLWLSLPSSADERLEMAKESLLAHAWSEQRW